jgi:predicted RNA binding protein YcfA (HicA-like mRNA interferase family)
MKLPRDVSGRDLIKSLQKSHYEITRQKGSHVRMTCRNSKGEHHLTIPDHDTLKIGTLSSILQDISNFQGLSKEEIINILFG